MELEPRRLVTQVAGRYRALPQLPVTLGEQSEPEPDPGAARWGTRAVVARGEVAPAASVPGVAVPVDGLFG